MIQIKELPDGRFEVTSDKGLVDIGCGAVKTLIVTEGEIEYVEEVVKNK